MTAVDLIAAVKAGDTDAVRALVARDPALAGATDEQGMPAVRIALYHQRRDVVDALLHAGPPLADADVAAVGDVPELRRRLAADPGLVRARTPDGFTPLHFAAFFGGPGAVEVLLGAGADPNAETESDARLRPLHSAAAARDNESARLLLEAGADPDAQQQGGYTALHSAAMHDDTELAGLLLRHGADGGVRSDAGADAAAMAREQGSAGVLALLGESAG
jgi:ankyrin repeat protein